MEKSLLEQALEYAEFGYFIFPCRNRYGGRVLSKNGKWIELNPKQPLIKNGVLSATRDLKQIGNWWKKWPNAMIGTNLGMSNRFVIDIDNHKVNGLDNWHSLGISDEGAQHVMTPSGGLHLYFSGQGRASTNSKLGIDTRGGSSYTLLPNSYIEDLDGSKKSYAALDDMFIEPKEVTEEIFEKLGLVRKVNPNRGNYISNLTISEELQRAKKTLYRLPNFYGIDYMRWVECGMALRKFGEDGMNVWIEWSQFVYEKEGRVPVDRGELEYKWSTLKEIENGITIATLYGFAKEEKKIFQ